MILDFPRALDFLVKESAPIKVLFGGRGAGKTENIAGALIILAINKQLRIACFRELQTSIEESVKQTIEAKISDMGVDSEFEILDKEIIALRTGSKFIFSGLRYNINKIKSMARIDIAWIEEAVNVSKTSWDKLEPTIRGRHKDDPNGMGGPFGKGPEIWVSFNPELDDDETYKRFVLQREKYAPEFALNKDSGQIEKYAIVKKVNWSDNKWFPNDLRRKMEILKAADPDAWLNVWEGHTKQTLDGAIFVNEIKKVLLEGRRGKVPYDPTRPVLTAWDLGHNDKTAIWFIQRVGMEFNLINYYENRLQKLPHYLEYIQSLGYVYSTFYQPHDADSETLAARSIVHQTRQAGYKVVVVPRVARKANGINASRNIFDLCNFDEENTADGWQCLSRYAYKVNENGNFSKEPEHDTPWSHGADGFQTFALSIRTETELKKPKPYSDPKIISFNNNSWMG